MATPREPGGHEAGQLLTAFDCITDPGLIVIGRMAFSVGPAGCITQVLPDRSTFQAVDCNLELDEHDGTGLDAARLGAICVGSGGIDACDTIVSDKALITGSTWGVIKAGFE